MTNNSVQLLQRLFDRRFMTMKLPLIVYLACLPLFFSASALSWPFPESAQYAPSQSRDCLIATTATETQDEKKPVEDEEPDCE